MKQAKKISQIISYIWLNEDPETAKELDGYFRRGDDEGLKKLLFANDPKTHEYILLLKVFQTQPVPELCLPVFAEEDRGYIKFVVVTDTFEGGIIEPGPSDNQILTVHIPYPPRPEITDITVPQTGYTVIKKSELRDWLSQPPHTEPYKQEYEVTCSLNTDGVIKAYDLQRYKNGLVMFLEDFGGESLKL